MLVYLALAAFPVFLGYLFPDLNSDKSSKIRFYIICGTAMLIVMGLRNPELGSTDTINYYNAMERAISSTSWTDYYNPDYFEIGSQLFIYLLSRVFSDAQWLLIISSLIYIVSIFYFVDHNSDDIPLSIMAYIALGLLVFHLQGMRQSLAMCLCLFAYEQAKRKHLLKFLVIVLLATTFHQTAILFFPIYWVSKLKYSRRNIFIMAAIGVVAMLAADRIAALANFIFEKSYTNIADSGGYVALIIYIIIIFTLLLYDDDLKDGNEQTPLLFVLMLGVVCYIFRYFGARMAERASYYYIFAQLALLPRVRCMVVEEQRELFRILMIIVSVLLFAYRLNGTDFVPYRFFWQ